MKLEEIAARLEATSGSAWHNDGHRIRAYAGGPILMDAKEFNASHGDLEFVANATVDVAWLLGEVNRLRKVLTEMISVDEFECQVHDRGSMERIARDALGL